MIWSNRHYTFYDILISFNEADFDNLLFWLIQIFMKVKWSRSMMTICGIFYVPYIAYIV